MAWRILSLLVGCRVFVGDEGIYKVGLVGFLFATELGCSLGGRISSGGWVWEVVEVI